MSSGLQILHLIEALGRGGAEKRLFNDVRYLDKNKFNNYICYLFPGNVDSVFINKLGMHIESVAVKKDIRLIFSLIKLVKFIKNNKIDIIHTQLFFADLIGRLAGFLTGTPVITTIQSSVYEKKVDFLYSKKRFLLDRITARLFNERFIAVSNYVKQSIQKRFGIKRDKIELIYNSVEDELNLLDKSVVESYRNRFKLNGSFLLLAVGKLNPGKGYEYLLKAVSKLEREDFRLLIAGDGCLKNALLDLTRQLNLDKKVIFLGQIDNIRELIFVSDIFIFPSLSEGMSFSLLEAMVLGKPVIVSDIEPNCEAVKDGFNGMIVSRADTVRLAKAIEYLITHPEVCKVLGEAARKTVLEKFNVQKSVKQLEELYEEVVVKRH